MNSTAARAMRLLLAAQPLTEAKVRFAWTLAAGPAVVRASSVTFADGILAVRVKSDSWRQAVERSRPVVHARLAEFLGPGIVRTITIASDDTIRRTLHHRP